MDFLNFLVIITGFGNLFLGYVVLTRGAKNKVTYSLGSWAIIGGLWSLALYLYHAQFIFSGLVWIKIVYLIVFFLVLGLFYFSSVFTRKSRGYIIFTSSLYLVISIPLLYSLFFTKLWIVDVVTKSWGPETVLGWAYIPVSIFWGFFGTWSVYNFMIEYFRSTGIERERVKYILAGVGLFIFIVLTADEIIPLFWNNTRYFRVSPLSISFFVGLTAYAILRYRLADIKVILTEALVAAMGLLLFSLPFFISASFSMKILMIAVFLIYCFIGSLLIKSTRREARAKEDLELKVQERTKELEANKKIAEDRAAELEKWYNLTISREARMAELKEKMKDMEEKEGK